LLRYAVLRDRGTYVVGALRLLPAHGDALSEALLRVLADRITLDGHAAVRNCRCASGHLPAAAALGLRQGCLPRERRGSADEAESQQRLPVAIDEIGAASSGTFGRGRCTTSLEASG
jgi:hypothetical protein